MSRLSEGLPEWTSVHEAVREQMTAAAAIDEVPRLRRVLCYLLAHYHSAGVTIPDSVLVDDDHYELLVSPIAGTGGVLLHQITARERRPTVTEVIRAATPRGSDQFEPGVRNVAKALADAGMLADGVTL